MGYDAEATTNAPLHDDASGDGRRVLRAPFSNHHQFQQLAMDYLSLAALLRYSPGIASTADLIAAWQVSQPSVSRRINALDRAGLIDAYPGHGAYQIHDLKLL